MTQPVPTYSIISRVHVSQWDDDLQATVPGWQFKVRWNQTGTILPVFVPDQLYTADNVDKLIRAAGALDSQVHQLGK